MPLNKQILTEDIKALLNTTKDNVNEVGSIDSYAKGLADIIDTYVKTALVTVTGTSVTGGAVTGTGTIS